MFGSIPALIIGIALLGVGIFYVEKCGGIRRNDPGRCGRTRRGLGRHCNDHPGWNLHDSIALIAFALAAGTLYLWLTHDGFAVLIDSITR